MTIAADDKLTGRSVIALLLCSILLCPPLHADDEKQPTLWLSKSGRVVDLFPDLKDKIERAFNHAGLNIKWINIPAERSVRESIAGNIDGEGIRNIEVKERAPQLLMISTPVARFSYWVYTHTDNDCSLQSLRKMIPVGVLGGLYFSRAYALSDLKPLKIKEFAQIPNILMAKRGGFSIFPEEVFDRQLGGTPNSLKKCGNKPLFIKSGYTFLNKKNKQYMPKLEAAYREIFSVSQPD